MTIPEKHIIHHTESLLAALTQLNQIGSGPLVLFIVDGCDRLVGTLTDGDSRRALISGATVQTPLHEIMHKNFKYMHIMNIGNVKEIKRLKELDIKLIPIVDDDMRIVDLIDVCKYKTRLPVDAVLMAGGKGERLRPLTEKTPKPLLKVGDRAIIDHNIDRLINYGIKNIYVTVNYLSEQFDAHFSQPRNGINIHCVREPEFFGTIGAIKLVEKFFNDTVLVMNSDLFTNIDYEDFYLHFKEHDAEMSVAAVPYAVSVPYGIFDLEGSDITGLTEKPTYNYYANAGIYLIKRTVLDSIPEKSFFNATDLIAKLIAEKRKVIRFPLNGTWIDIGNPQDYQKANELVGHLNDNI